MLNDGHPKPTQTQTFQFLPEKMKKKKFCSRGIILIVNLAGDISIFPLQAKGLTINQPK